MSKKLKIILGASGAVAGAGILAIGLGVGFYQSKEIEAINKVHELQAQEADLKAQRAEKAKQIEDLSAQIAAKASSQDKKDKDKVKELQESLKKIEEEKDAQDKELSDLNKDIIEKLAYVAKGKTIPSDTFADSAKEQVKLTAEYLVRLFKFVRSEERMANPGTAPSMEKAKEMSSFYDKYISQIKAVNEENLTPDSLAWKKAIEFQWEIAQGNYKTNLQLLFSTFNWGSSAVFPASHFSGLMDDVLSYSTEDGTKAILKQWLVNAKEAVKDNMVFSKVFLKLHIQYILTHALSEEVLAFAKGTAASIKVTDLIKNSKLSDEGKKFLTYYVTTYYQASKIGLGENLPEFILYKSNGYASPNQEGKVATEVENTMEVVDRETNTSYKVYGAGLTEKDLKQRNIGLGFIQGNGDINGANMYKQILKTQTTTLQTPKQVNEDGYSTTTKSVENFKKAANELADLLVGPGKVWSDTIKYDADGVGPQEPTEVTVTIRNAKNEIDYQAFIKWLNQEQFYFGREDASYWTEDKKAELKKDSELAPYIKDLTKKGYDFLLSDESKDQKYGSITNEQLYYGALSAFKGYQEFKDATQKYGASFFTKEVPDYGIETYNFGDREYTGVGSYSSRVKKFQFNSDAYLGLPKWSLTSFANHESMMGHHNQTMYADHYLTNVDGVEFGNQFGFTSYIEGWALFMEWFGIEAGFYGTPNYDSKNVYAAPTDFSTAKGITSFFTAKDEASVTDDMLSKIKDLHNGIYWTIAGKSTTAFANDKAKALVANKIANILQYCGALNEAQLRNMRRAVDTALHSSEVESHKDLPAGASLQDVRDFMKKNSALGIGDITSESKRYLAYVGQATSYNAGKAAMIDLYEEVLKSKNMTREEFVNDKKAIGEFFDRLLLNGALPLDALIASVHAYYGIDEK